MRVYTRGWGGISQPFVLSLSYLSKNQTIMEMKMNTKLEVRACAVQMVMEKLGAGATKEKVVDMAKCIEEYMMEGVELPDAPNPVDSICEIIQKIADLVPHSLIEAVLKASLPATPVAEAEKKETKK